MAGLGKVLKVAQKAYKVISAPSRKLNQLQTPFTGKNLSTGKKLANCILKPLNFTTDATIILSGLGGAGALATALYADLTDNYELRDKYLSIGAKGGDVLFSSLGGLLIGGPIGAIAGVVAALSTDKSCMSKIAEAVGDEEVAKAIETTTAQMRQEIKNEVKELFGMTTSNETNNEKIEVANTEVASNVMQELIKKMKPGEEIVINKLAGMEMTLETSNGKKIPLKNGDLIRKEKDGYKIIPAENIKIHEAQKETLEKIQNMEVGDTVIVNTGSEDYALQYGTDSFQNGDTLIRVDQKGIVCHPYLSDDAKKMQSETIKKIQNMQVGDTVIVNTGSEDFTLQYGTNTFQNGDTLIRVDQKGIVCHPYLSDDAKKMQSETMKKIQNMQVGDTVEVKLARDDYTIEVRNATDNSSMTKIKNGQKITLTPEGIKIVEPKTPKTIKVKSLKLKSSDDKKADEKESAIKPANSPKTIKLKGGLKLKKS